MQLNRFEAFISETIRWETGGDRTGAYTNDPRDAGGETKWGISKKAHPSVDIKELGYRQAVDIYKRDYYLPFLDLIMSENIAFKVFDMGVLCGVGTAVKLLQEVIKEEGGYTVRIDGKLGPLTLTALHMVLARKGEERVYEVLVMKFVRRFDRIVLLKPWNRRFIKGWLERATFLFKPFPLKEVKNEKS